MASKAFQMHWAETAVCQSQFDQRRLAGQRPVFQMMTVSLARVLRQELEWTEELELETAV